MTGEKIRALRKLFRLSQVEFAKSFGISQGNLSEIEKGKSKPSADTLIALRTTYGIDLNDLLGEVNQKDFYTKRSNIWTIPSTEVELLSHFRKLDIRNKR
ncbi:MULTISPECIES: helix-turn-helix transcriptional regulator [unclassified Paenibacillus]|nr:MULTISPECIES: helix-turn-helix transcriptional regulator [unclassified Paenibacillus]MBP1157067.1 transcriptional regulator with XRE-family HTH domain [Paenibacillus sp. PvP091]MBP1172194.1 transcriptional regulator with XRE-family HTH domain [Paenibacillus sp. PvR098]MBP2438575.1 transcriptional regulator with XRE-family HTH domain [Paenibacillus sp. PvP052]